MERLSNGKYMHIYCDLDHTEIFFQNFTVSCRLGEAFVDFLCFDLDDLETDPERLLTIHPYFEKWTIESANEYLFKNDENSQGIDYLKKLQKELLDAVREDMQGGFGMNRYFKNHVFFAGMKPVYSCKEGRRFLYMDYFVCGFEDCLICEYYEMIRHHQVVKTCKNCGRLFVPKRGNIDYCTRIYSKEGKSCADVGYTYTFAKNVKNDELLQAYTRAYKAHYARMTKPRKKAGNMSREAFEAWYKQAKEGLDLARAGKMDADEYKKWLKE